jgi:protein arginine N-methyltransferase 1
MYSVDAYGRMIADDKRTGAYIRALKLAIKPGSVVVDIGTGPGFFAMLACKLGARRVYAIEPDNVIQVARDCARLNGFSDRIEFIQDLSTNVTLPETADVIVADLRGVLPFFQANLPSVQDAANRFLAKNGILIPLRDHLFAAIAHAPEIYRKIEAPWGQREGVTLAAGRKVVINTWSKNRVEKADVLCEPVRWHTITYDKIDSFDVAAQMSFAVTKSGTAHGVVAWFESDLLDGVSMSNAPGEPELLYGNAFFPLAQPVDLEAGDDIEFRIRADLIKDEYVWSWETRICDRQDAKLVKTHLRQSTLFGAPFTRDHLKKRASSFVPILDEQAAVSSFILSQIDGKSSIEQLAAKVAEKFPQRFASAAAAMDVVAEISAKYSK